MIKLRHLLFSVSFIVLLSCSNRSNQPYAIKDFRKSLQPHLIKIVTEGIVYHLNDTLSKTMTDKELIHLSQSEHPVLRASAFNEILDRESFNHYDIIINHLDDTASVSIYAGEFGIWHRTVSDHILFEASWKTEEEKKQTIEQVLTKHNYLRSAYTILEQMEPQEKYYSPIRAMAIRPRLLNYAGFESSFDDIEYALYGLAKFKKKEDINSIKNKLMEHVWELSDVSFRLMKEFPDTAYFDVLQTYHQRQFYQFSGNRPYGFSGINADRATPEDFIQALVIQQNDRSAKLLDTMLIYLPNHSCMPDRDNIINEVIDEIWEHPCPAYAKLREKIKQKAEENLKRRLSFTLDPIHNRVDTTKKRYYWRY